MALILCIDTSTPVCSVALTQNGNLLHSIEKYEGFSHASHLTVLIDEIFKNNNIDIKQIDAVAISCGPGSYTGLRIGVSTAKGLCYALDKPLIAIGSLKILAWPVIHQQRNEALLPHLFCPMIDARRMEVYMELFDINMSVIEPVRAQIVDEQTFSQLLENHTVSFFGDGAPKCSEIINHVNANFIAHQYPLAKNMGTLAQASYDKNEFVDVAYFEPFYLKDFVATTPKVKTLQ
jgi:tRNA threonylcarbamoyladenosine biosynthesis protein TsaB